MKLYDFFPCSNGDTRDVWSHLFYVIIAFIPYSYKPENNLNSDMRNDYVCIEHAVAGWHSGLEIDGLTQRPGSGYVEIKLTHIQSCLAVFP